MDPVYNPPAFRLDDEGAWRIVEDAGAGTLVVATPTGLESAFAPVLVAQDRRSMSLHVARANPWLRALTPGAEVLGLFVAASAYVSPLNYPSRHDNLNVVPTWNYALAQVRTTATIHDDPQWLWRQVTTLTGHFEEGHDPAWTPEHLDPGFRDAQLGAIVGVELSVVSIEGKGKLSQNRPDLDRLVVHEAFEAGSLRERLIAQRMESPE